MPKYLVAIEVEPNSCCTLEEQMVISASTREEAEEIYDSLNDEFSYYYHGHVIKELPEDTPDGKIDESRWIEVKNESVLLPYYNCAKCGGETMIRYPFCPYCKRTMTNSTIEPRRSNL